MVKTESEANDKIVKTWGAFLVFYTCKGYKSSTRIEALGAEDAARRVLEGYAGCKAVTSVMAIRKGGAR